MGHCFKSALVATSTDLTIIVNCVHNKVLYNYYNYYLLIITFYGITQALSNYWKRDKN